mmetsp:Transcript_2701/g.3541  ORF Transcript_2701/g.3541 Transcript_2701/m.3541 type:complete len:379 (+) Transcript_2701:515-1651(+)
MRLPRPGRLDRRRAPKLQQRDERHGLTVRNIHHGRLGRRHERRHRPTRNRPSADPRPQPPLVHLLHRVPHRRRVLRHGTVRGRHHRKFRPIEGFDGTRSHDRGAERMGLDTSLRREHQTGKTRQTAGHGAVAGMVLRLRHAEHQPAVRTGDTRRDRAEQRGYGRDGIRGRAREDGGFDRGELFFHGGFRARSRGENRGARSEVLSRLVERFRFRDRRRDGVRARRTAPVSFREFDSGHFYYPVVTRGTAHSAHKIREEPAHNVQHHGALHTQHRKHRFAPLYLLFHIRRLRRTTLQRPALYRRHDAHGQLPLLRKRRAVITAIFDRRELERFHEEFTRQRRRLRRDPPALRPRRAVVPLGPRRCRGWPRIRRPLLYQT